MCLLSTSTTHLMELPEDVFIFGLATCFLAFYLLHLASFVNHITMPIWNPLSNSAITERFSVLQFGPIKTRVPWSLAVIGNIAGEWEARRRTSVS